jgi:predicted Zn-dependent protease
VSPPGGEPLEALLFDGRTAEAVPVRVAVGGGQLRVSLPDGTELFEAPLDGLALSDAFASAPRQITLPGRAVVEVPDGAALTAALSAAGRRPGLVDRLQQRWLAATVALVATVAALAAGYLRGLPLVVRAIAARLPESAEQRLGDGVLEVLDGGFLQPTALDEDERADVEARIAEATRRGAPGLHYRILFRRMGRGPDVNAFAIPGGTLVLLDGLVERTDGDERLVAVVGHELGHLARRHSTQALLEAAGVGAATSLLWGDFSGQAATVPAVLAMTRYSREAEREADEEAVRFLRDAGLGPVPMLEALCLLSEVEEEAGTRGIPGFLSTHPDIGERIARVRVLAGLGGQGCDATSTPP